jgi:hypothetical protein
MVLFLLIYIRIPTTVINNRINNNGHVQNTDGQLNICLSFDSLGNVFRSLTKTGAETMFISPLLPVTLFVSRTKLNFQT